MGTPDDDADTVAPRSPMVRSYVDADLEGLAQLLNGEKLGLARFGVPHSPWSIQRAVREQGIVDIVVAVSEVEGVVGCLWLMRQAFHIASRPGGIFVENACVSSSHRRSLLLVEIAAYARRVAAERGFGRLDLGVYSSLEGSIRMYRKLGFAPVALQQSDHGDAVQILESYPGGQQAACCAHRRRG